ncbi:tetratricopeptide repeat protein [Streptomonospora sp. S1-112]|uniref:Tetratricopeptide repeat protein n=1 Tax=Streptomonospora mangrovi TaxID=2883123 RepID=A0A9X3NI59_9ACTN|nr:tetratricopeptide repeat protein [Streptomonospora mangrovi]MDA0564142.1 tetratricopeptide repeat protein [Streptomonospora mangrovi]
MEIRLLGPSVRIMVDGESVDAGTPKERSILANLALEPGKVVPTQLIIDRVWGDAPTPRVRSSLYAYITRLRGRLAAAGGGSGVGLRSRSQGYLLEIAKEAVDWHRAELLRVRARALAESGDHRAAVVLLSEALDLWEGHPLAEISGTWAEGVRTNMLKSWSLLVQRWAESSMRIGHFDDVVTRVSEAAAADPVNERLAAVLMEALAGSGRHAEALEIHARLRAELADRYGADPGPATQAVFERILAGGGNGARTARQRAGAVSLPVAGAEVDPPPPEPGAVSRGAGDESTSPRASNERAPELPVFDNLPRDIDDFTAREAELADIVARARGRPDATTVVVVHGMAGRGKTALAVRAAHTVRPEFHTRLHLDMRGHTEGQPPLAPEHGLYRLLRAVGVPADEIPSEPEARAALWSSRLTGRRTLILLDDAIAHQVGPLIPGIPGCTVLVTSRRRLTELHGVQHLELAALDPAESAAMFLRAAGRDPDAETDPATRTAVERITADCEGLPLALRVAGARLLHRPAWTPQHLADRIARNGLAEMRSTSHDVAGVFATSFHALSSSARSGFLRVSLHPSDRFSLPAAAAAIGDEDEGFAAAEAVIEELLDAHLIEETGPESYRMHALLREFARGRAAEETRAEERRSVLLRIIDFYWAAADAADRTVHPGRPRPEPRPSYRGGLPELDSPLAARRWYEAEYAALEAAMACARDGEFAPDPDFRARAAYLPLSLGGLYDSDGPWGSAEEQLRAALDLLRERDDAEGTAFAAYELSRVQRRLGRTALAEANSRLALDMWRGREEGRGEAYARNQLGLVLGETGKNTEALIEHRVALKLLRASGDKRGCVQALDNIGTCAASMGDFSVAESAFGEALELLSDMEEPSIEASVLNNHAAILHHRGYHREATLMCDRATSAFEKLGNRLAVASSLSNGAEVLAYIGQHESALSRFRRARDHLIEMGDVVAAVKAIQGIGSALLALGRAQEALRALEEGLRLAGSCPAPAAEAPLLLACGDVARALRRTDDARRHYEAALELARHGVSALDELVAYDRIGDLCAAEGLMNEAVSHWRSAHGLAARMGTHHSQSTGIKISVMGQYDSGGQC